MTRRALKTAGMYFRAEKKAATAFQKNIGCRKIDRYVLNDGIWISKNILRHRFADDPLEYTIIGVQKGDTLIKSEDVDSVTTVKGIMTAQEFAEENKKECAAARFSA